MTIPLPPLKIAQLAPFFLNNNSSERQIKWVMKYLHDFNLWKTNSTLDGYTVVIYKSVAKVPSLSKGFVEDCSSEEDEPTSAPEYLAFLSQESSSKVYVLASSKAFKHIRPYCSEDFPKHFYSHYADQTGSIDKIASSHMFSPIAESTFVLKGEAYNSLNSETQVFRSWRVIFNSLPGVDGGEIKVKFTERSVVIYRDLKLAQHVQLLKPILNEPVNLHTDLFGNCFSLLEDLKTLTELTRVTYLYLSGFFLPGYQEWKFNLELTDKWCSEGYAFRLRHQGSSSYPISPDTNKFLTIEDVWNRQGCTPEQLENGELYLEYKTLSNHWHQMPILDCIEGWLTDKAGHSYYKIDQKWYQIDQKYTAKLNSDLTILLQKEKCVLADGQKGYLNKIWNDTIGETDYNRLYTTEDTPFWFDGNQKRLDNFEIFDILQIDGDDVFIYHVKDTFGTELKKLGAQLLSSAQRLHSCRISTSHSSVLTDYCQRVGGKHAQILEHALLTKNLHFVAAFRFYNEPINEMIKSQSWSAKLETLKMRALITELNKEFEFHISPIKGAKKPIQITIQNKNYEIALNNKQYYVNNHPATFDGNYYIWDEPDTAFAISPSGFLWQEIAGTWQHRS